MKLDPNINKATSRFYYEIRNRKTIEFSLKLDPNIVNLFWKVLVQKVKIKVFKNFLEIDEMSW